MRMAMKNALVALGIAVLTGTLAVAALADDQGMNMYSTPDSSVSSQPEQGMGQPDTAEIREPVETGSVPDRSMDSFDLHAGPGNDESTVESGGLQYRPDIDVGP